MDLLSDLGGQVGLWMGLSVLTLFEVVELVWDLTWLGCCRPRGRGRSSKPRGNQTADLGT